MMFEKKTTIVLELKPLSTCTVVRSFYALYTYFVFMTRVKRYKVRQKRYKVNTESC